MTTYIALLRAVNVAGRRMVSMGDLRDLLGALGYSEVRSLLQSGNLVFRGASKDAQALERVLEKEVSAQLALETDVFIRTAAEWQQIVARNPFAKDAQSDPGHLVVMLLKDRVAQDRVRQLRAAIKGREVVHAERRQLYIVYPDGIGRSKLTSGVIERALGGPGTARNWNTTLKLASVAGF